MTSIATRLNLIRQQIHDAELACGRKAGAVQLLAVSKTKSAEELISAYLFGQRQFAESYVQEALMKQRQLSAYDITWHFIGPIQSNKTRAIASSFDWVHSVDRYKIAKRLNDQRLDQLAPLNVCLQVNISAEASKSGASLEAMPELLQQISELPRLRLRGVMAIPEQQQDIQRQRLPYRLLRESVEKLHMPQLDSYSFGMTADMQAAICEGATLVRIGTALFGARS